MNLKLINRNRIYAGRVFNIVVDDVEYPNGRKSVREVAEHIGGSVVMAVFPDEKIILVHQHRYPFDAFIWELPAGKLNQKDNVCEDPLECAKRELEEETGHSASKWTKLTSIFTTPGFCNETLHIYMAQELTALPGGRRLEEGEETMGMSIVSLDEAIKMIERQEIRDGKSISGILLGERILRGQSHGRR